MYNIFFPNLHRISKKKKKKNDGYNEILMNQDEIEIVDVEKELNQSSGVNVGPFSDLDIEIIEVGNKYEDFKCG